MPNMEIWNTRTEVPPLFMMSVALQEEADADGERDHDEHAEDHEERPARGNPYEPPEERAAATRHVRVHVGGAGRSEVQAAALGIYGRRHGAGKALDLQLASVATEADAVDVLHGLGQAGQHRHVRVQLGQAEGGQRGVRSAQGALQALGLRRLDVHTRQAFQAEGVAALQHLGRVEDVVELTETHGALQLRYVLRTGWLSCRDVRAARRRLRGLAGAVRRVRRPLHGCPRAIMGQG